MKGGGFLDRISELRSFGGLERMIDDYPGLRSRIACWDGHFAPDFLDSALSSHRK